MPDSASTFAQTYLLQFGFYFDETQRLLELARALPDQLYRAQSDYSYASIHNTFAHLLSATQLWRRVLAGAESARLEADGIDALVAHFEVERAAWRELIASLDNAALLEAVARPTPFGIIELKTWQTLQHVILHGMGHLTELARMLFEAGQAPGDIDFLLYEAP